MTTFHDIGNTPQPETTNTYVGGILNGVFNGDKFPGSMSYSSEYEYVDYWTLRARSSALFKENPYCKGIIRRLVTNEINTGLKLESSPIEQRIGITEDEALEWGEQREIDWSIWASNPKLCDWKKQKTLTELSIDCRITALISGDCLQVLRINSKTGLPAIELIDGKNIQSPILDSKNKNKDIQHGVELDSQGRQIAFWVKEDFNKFKRIPAFGEKSGRRIAWLVYGSERRLDEVRGEPILSNMLYMLKELDRYRDSEQRAATINAMLPMFIKKTENTPSTRVATGGAVRNGVVEVGQADGSTKNWNTSAWLPGMVPQNLAKGEEPVNFNTTRPNANLQKFEETIINTFAWTLEVPPEIVRLLFQNSFSAARQANNEFDVYLKKRFKAHGKDFYQPVYEEWLLQQALIGDIQAQPMLEAWRNPRMWREYGAWINAEWTGLSRPSIDILKDVKASVEMVKNGFATTDQQCRKFSGLPYNTVIKIRKREIEFAEKNGISLASEEDNNGIPIGGGTEPAEPGNQPQNILNARLNKQNKTIKDLEDMIFDLQEKFEDLGVAANGNG